MSAFVPWLLWLVVVWVALWEQVSPANVISGVVVAVALLVLFQPPGGRRTGTLRVAATVRFLAYFLWKLVEASAVVAWEVVTPRNRINEGIVAIPIRGVSDLIVTLVANAISLTPGTLTLEVRRHPTTLYVHVLHLHDVEAVRRDVRHLEALAILAFGPADVVRAVAGEGAAALGEGLRPSQATRSPDDDPPEARP